MDKEPTWDWAAVGDDSSQSSPAPEPAPEPTRTKNEPAREPEATPQYGPRTCRICLDTEEPKFSAATSTFGFSSSTRPTYVSDDPELGRLLSPCKCKGSQKYVHEGCLNAWRLANPMETRNYWQCPTCKFSYRISRLHYASIVSSKWAQIALAVVFVVLSLFVLGFIGDPIFDLWMDPLGAIGDTFTSVVTDIEAIRPSRYETPATWYEHFAKGFFSLGVVGIIKSFIGAAPWHWISLRSSLGGRRQAGGRARVENISIIFVLIGAFTFLLAIWKAVKALSVRILQSVSDSVLDVEEDDVPTNTAQPKN